MLNIGCGNHYNNGWINIDINSKAESVLKHDLRKGLPFPDNYFDAVYSSHLLEHLTKEEAKKKLLEERRVLKNNGIIRIVVPDLERICRNYIKYLTELSSGNSINEFRYQYTILELFDQFTRKESGGELGKLWAEGAIKDPEFVLERHGVEVYDLIKSENCDKKSLKRNNGSSNSTVLEKLKNGLSISKMKVIEKTIKLLLGSEYVEYFREGIFRNKGEIHLAMYDKYSLEKLLLNCGFCEVSHCTPLESRIVNFSNYELDIVNGNIRKPDSLYMEATVRK